MKSLKKILLGLLLIGVFVNLDLNAGKRGNVDVYFDNEVGCSKADGRRGYHPAGEDNSSGEESFSEEESFLDETDSEGGRRGAKRVRFQEDPAPESYEADDEGGVKVPVPALDDLDDDELEAFVNDSDDEAQDSDSYVGSDAEMSQADAPAIEEEDHYEEVRERIFDDIRGMLLAGAAEDQAQAEEYLKAEQAELQYLVEGYYADLADQAAARIQAVVRGRQARRALAVLPQALQIVKAVPADRNYANALQAMVDDGRVNLPVQARNGAIAGLVFAGGQIGRSFLPVVTLAGEVQAQDLAVIALGLTTVCAPVAYITFQGGKWVVKRLINNPDLLQAIRSKSQDALAGVLERANALPKQAKGLWSTFKVYLGR